MVLSSPWLLEAEVLQLYKNSSTTVHATTKLIVPLCSAQDGESTDMNCFEHIAKFNEWKAQSIIREFSSIWSISSQCEILILLECAVDPEWTLTTCLHAAVRGCKPVLIPSTSTVYKLLALPWGGVEEQSWNGCLTWSGNRWERTVNCWRVSWSGICEENKTANIKL